MNELSDEQLVSQALNNWANCIETDDTTLSAIDAQACQHKFNALSLDQMKTVIRLRELANTFAGA